MAAGPAKATGVNDIYLTSPCPNNKINNLVLAAASIAGIQKVYSLGGVQAIAAFALGTDTFPKVQKIVGPGNQYVNEAKRQLYVNNFTRTIDPHQWGSIKPFTAQYWIKRTEP